MKKLISVAAVTAIVLSLPASAVAKPVPCGPMAVTDPAGDQQLHVPQVGVPTMQDAAAPTDFTGLFLRDDSGKVSANLVISELTKTVPDPATAVRWTFYYTVGEQAYYARVILNGDGTVEYLYGTDDGATLSELGTMKGAFDEGEDGVISFVLPAAAGGKPGTTFTVANAIAAYQFETGLGSSADFMPDSGEFEATVPTCEAAPAPAPSGPGAPTPPPAGGRPAPPSSNPGATQRDFQVSVKPTTLRAKKLKRGKAITFTLTSRETVSGLTATLKKGTRTVGGGKLARLSGRGKLKVKPRGRLKKGAYTLVITGRRADGSTGTTAVKIRVR